MDRHWRRLGLIVILGDALAVFATYTVVAGVLFGFGQLRADGQLWPLYPFVSGGIAILTVLLGWQHGMYRRWALLGGHKVYPLVVSISTYGIVAVMIISYVVGGPPLVSRGWLLGSWIGTIITVSLSRMTWRQLALAWRKRGRLVRRLLIAGANQQGIAVAQQLHNPKRHGTEVLGFLDDYQRPGTEVIDGLKVVDHPGNVIEQARALGADEVIIIPGGLAWDSHRLLAEMVTRPDSPIEARISPTFYDLLTTSAELTQTAYVPLLTLDRNRLSGMNAGLKSLLDHVASSLILLAILPALIWWWAKAWKNGIPMLIRERAIGLGGRAFDVFGLHANLVSSPVLRRLPAAWNVFRRDLSLVGPRPLREKEVGLHDRWLANLCAMRPGLTGLWRVRGGELSLEETVALDLFYVRNYTLGMDMQIMYNTGRQLLRRSLGESHGLARWNGTGARDGVPVQRPSSPAVAPPATSPVSPPASPRVESRR